MSGFEVDGTHTLRDLGLCCSNRVLTPPVKKTVRKSIPYSDGELDFSLLGGRAYFEARTLSFSFDLLADTPEELEREVSRLREFVSLVHDADIYDDDVPYYHFHGSFDAIEEEPDEYGLSSSVTVSFSVNPYKESNEFAEQPVQTGDNIVRNDGMWTRPAIVATDSVTVQAGTLKQTYPAGETVMDIPLEHGDNAIKISSGSATIKWRERRL